ncbi:MAG TPA: hypothetical protein VG937_09475 [Polyangiaceae bacterium]|nr:hypothetical protein [Polyangiaceae bacterium]
MLAISGCTLARWGVLFAALWGSNCVVAGGEGARSATRPSSTEAQHVAAVSTGPGAPAPARLVDLRSFEPRDPGAAECKTDALEPSALTADVSFAELVPMLTRALDHAEWPLLRDEFAAFAARHALDAQSPQLLQDYRRLRVLFEAVRDGGFWRIRWAITDQEPSSRRIWQSWDRSLVADAFLGATAIAECDEISALYSFLARRLGVRGVGLFYPTWNHTIASWTPAQSDPKRPVLVLVPTTQIFLGCDAGFDSTSFKTRQRASYEYPLKDLPEARPIPRASAEFLLRQLSVYGSASPELNALIRAHRSLLLDSSMGACAQYRRELARRVTAQLTCEDRRALAYYFQSELRASGGSALEQLATLATQAK